METEGEQEQRNRIQQELLGNVAFGRSFHILALLGTMDNTGTFFELDGHVCVDTPSVAKAVHELWRAKFRSAEDHEFFSSFRDSLFLLSANASEVAGLSFVRVSPAIALTDATGLSLEEKYGSYDDFDWDLDEDESGDTQFERSGGWEQTKFVLHEDKLEQLVPRLAETVLRAGEVVSNPLEERAIGDIQRAFSPLSEEDEAAVLQTLIFVLEQPEFRLGPFDANNME